MGMNYISHSLFVNSCRFVKNLVLSLEQLSIAEFTGKKARPKIYGKVLGTYLVLIWYWRSNIAQFWFSKSFFCVNNQPNLCDFFIEEYKNERSTFNIDIFCKFWFLMHFIFDRKIHTTAKLGIYTQVLKFAWK